MRFLRAIPLVLACLAGPCFGTEKPAAEPPVRPQVDPGDDLVALYPQAGSIGLAIAVVPDPHVPRYRRLFDLEVQAITIGMLRDGYVLDRYAFPWSGTGGDSPAPPPSQADPDRDAFGVMIFRCDGWRGNPCSDPSQPAPEPAGRATGSAHVRAIYFVTDTATWGVATPPLACAARRIRAQLAGLTAKQENDRSPCRTRPMPARDSVPDAPATPGPRFSLLQYPGMCPSGGAHRTLVLLGPTFSGALDSVGQHLGELLGPEITDVCLVSGFTTVSTNQHVPEAYDHLHYARQSLDDGIKLLALANLAASFGYFDPHPADRSGPHDDEVAFLTEASTFGYGICNPSATLPADARARVQKFCAEAQTLYFPAAIADIRYGLEQQHERQQTSVEAAMKVALPSEHLTLDVGAENGSEFPENRQSKLTAASQQLALDHVLDRLQQDDPKMVVVVATDVRDRLFLFDQLRSRLPSALLIDLESDILLAHPDFLHASRGAITVASANLFVRRDRLFGCEGSSRIVGLDGRVPSASWALDGQGMLADTVARLDESSPPATRAPCIDDPDRIASRMPVLHVVTLKGLRRISKAFEPVGDEAIRTATERRETRRGRLDGAQWLGLFCCAVIVLPWLWIRPMQRSANGARYFSAPIITAVAGAASLLSWTFAMAAAYGDNTDPESGFALAYWSVAILLLALGGLYVCVRRLHESGPGAGKLPRRYRWAISLVGLLACGLAAVPVMLRQLSAKDPVVHASLADRPAIDEDLVTRLALDIGQGLAYHVVTAVGVVTLLFTMISLATGAAVMTRNNALLAIRSPCSDCDVGARTPRFPSPAIAAIVLIVALIALPSLLTPLGGPRLSIFGYSASVIATLVMVITTLGASTLTMVALHASRRVRTIAAHIGRCVTPKQPGAADPAREYPGLWPTNDWQPNLFAATPAVARVSSEIIEDLNRNGRLRCRDRTGKTWKRLIKEFLGECDGVSNINDGAHRRAVFALLASEVSLYRWFVGGAVLCALASVCAAYLFPIEADPLLMWNLGVLIVHALLAGYVATTFERDGVLSNILCNRPRKMEFSASLFTYAALPFFALGFAIAVSQVPGVVDWGGGVLTLLAAVGLRP